MNREQLDLIYPEPGKYLDEEKRPLSEAVALTCIWLELRRIANHLDTGHAFSEDDELANKAAKIAGLFNV